MSASLSDELQEKHNVRAVPAPRRTRFRAHPVPPLSRDALAGALDAGAEG